MKRIYLALISILIAFPLLAQTHNDYIEDGVTGGVDRAFNGILWMIIIAVVAVILLFVIGGIQKFIWWYDPSTSPEYKEKQKKRLEESRKPINKLLLSDKTLARAHTCIRPQKKGKKLCPFPRIL